MRYLMLWMCILRNGENGRFYMMCILPQLKIIFSRVPIMAQGKWILLVSMRMRVQFLALISRSGSQSCHELWCRSQTQLGSGIVMAVAKARSCSSDLIPSLGISICHRCRCKKKKIKYINNNFQEFPGGLAQYRSGVVTAVVLVQSLARALPHATRRG